MRKPDLDNLVKALKDALTGIVWKDDAQIVSLCARKTYGDRPAIYVKVKCDKKKVLDRIQKVVSESSEM